MMTMMIWRRVRAPKHAAALVSRSRVGGLRARLKPERFWFDSRGWDDNVAGWSRHGPEQLGERTHALAGRSAVEMDR